MKSKKGRLKKVLSMILCGALFTMNFALSDLGSVKAYADTDLGTSVKVTLNNLPVSGESTDISSFSVSTTDTNYTVKIDNTDTGMPAGWYIANSSGSYTGSSAGDKFLGGKYYLIAVIFEANEGYFFNNVMDGNMNLTITNGCTTKNAVFNQKLKWDTENPSKVKSFRAFVSFYCDPKTYTVSFDPGNGSGNMTSQNANEGDYELPSCDFTPPTNEEFIGWNVESDTTLKQPGDTIDLRKNTTLHAKYANPVAPYPLYVECDSNKGRIIVNCNGYTTEARTFAKDADIQFVAQPNSGWLIDQWSSDPVSLIIREDKKFASISGKMPAKAVTVSLTFKKDPAAKTITLDPQGGSVEPTEIMTDADGYLQDPYSNPIELPTPSANGATFKYWSTSINGTEYNKSAKFTEDTTLYAVWEGTPKPGPKPDPKKDPKKDQSSTTSHVHSFKWQTIVEPTKDVDGLEGEVCSCGAIRKTQPLSAYVYAINEYAIPLINAAKPGQTITFEFGEWNSFPKSFMEKLVEKNGQNVTFVFHYKWNHVKQEITIPAGTPIDLNFDWYGPAKMAELYGMN